MPYPTAEEILRLPAPKFKKGTISLLRTWWRVSKTLKKANRNLWDDIGMTRQLLNLLSKHYDKPLNEIVESDRWAYSPTRQIIMIDSNKKMSILSALHEFGHHLFGPSELQACRWSVWLFKRAFPKAFSKLKFKGHMLVINDDMI